MATSQYFVNEEMLAASMSAISGVRQECIMSLVTFFLVMDEIMGKIIMGEKRFIDRRISD
jgi:hypothetical protein